ncbi:pickpocket protein 28-like [Contarinia nasturtii]|uniref:pickpocket protein 28-like n=1 Tax=Contarinia nasturtii TaxID=265458 RepID=UPI0012D3C2E1|nr:pickpocket protein 28-like [Contarinia nasturtii]
MIRSSYVEWQENPVKLSITDKWSLIDNIPFPTLTICPAIKTQRKIIDLTSAIKSPLNLSDRNFSSEHIYDLIEMIAPTSDNSMIFCLWKATATDVPCGNIIVPVLTEDGLCFSLNAMNSHEMYTERMVYGMMMVKSNPNGSSRWSMENGYTKLYDDENYPYPVKPLQWGRLNYLAITLATLVKDIEYQCGFDQGFKLILSTPGDAVQTSQNYFRLSNSQRALIRIMPELTITTDKLRHFQPSQRKCFFQSDRRLHFFKIYSKINCEEECLANFTQNTCGCVKFSMPRDKGTKICGGAKIECMKEAQRKFSTTQTGRAFRDECNCMPACTFVKYKAYILRSHDSSSDEFSSLG